MSAFDVSVTPSAADSCFSSTPTAAIPFLYGPPTRINQKPQGGDQTTEYQEQELERVA